jgi:hypothetical protein
LQIRRHFLLFISIFLNRTIYFFHGFFKKGEEAQRDKDKALDGVGMDMDKGDDKNCNNYDDCDVCEMVGQDKGRI